jgi:hypothetical protein
MDTSSLFSLATIAVIVGATWRLSAKLTAIPGLIAKAMRTHEDDCLGHDSAKRRQALAHPPVDPPARAEAADQ